jgi:hypothetical protein
MRCGRGEVIRRFCRDPGSALAVADPGLRFGLLRMACLPIASAKAIHGTAGRWHSPAVEIASFYADQFPDKDMARRVSRDYKVPLYPSIAEALCLGGKDLAVDAILLIGEHGDYPVNAKGQRAYPRKRFFDESVKVFRTSGRVAVPPCRPLLGCRKRIAYVRYYG